jgi:ferric-dicitrate binding protein FerR (iron transport regulator)
MKGNIVKKYLSGRFSPATEEKVQRWIIKDENREAKEQASLDYWNELDIKPNATAYAALKRINRKIGFPQKQNYWRRIAAVLIPLFILAGGLYYQSTRNSLIEIAVAYGEEKRLVLPDSSEIRINAGTRVKYPAKFDKGQRTVYLSGEAYFSVKKDSEKPFIVQTKDLSVKALGTKFNVKAYPDENKTITTLTDGKIEVNTISKESLILNPNEQLTFDNQTSKINIETIPSDETIGWVSGQIIFANASFKEILQTLERRFDVSFETTTVLPDGNYTVKFLKNDSLEYILNILKEIVGDFSCKKINDKIIISI